MSVLGCLRVEWLDRLEASLEPPADPSPNYGKKFLIHQGFMLNIKLALTCSTCRKTRIRFRPANLAMFSSDQRSASARSSANKYGYLETSSSPWGTL